MTKDELKKEIIKIETTDYSISDLISLGDRIGLGETEDAGLSDFLFCEAFENRFDLKHRTALSLAAMIIKKLNV